MKPFARATVACLALSAHVLGSHVASADARAPSLRNARPRTCCGLANHLPLHLGSAHVPITMDVVTSAQSLGPHSYLGDAASQESNGILYTRRGGFIDTGHCREYADQTAHLIMQLRPLLARGEGVLHLRPRDGDVLVRVVARVPEADIDRTSVLLAQRIAFQISVWVEVTQHFGHTVIRGAEEYFSSFTPEDLYSNLLGATLGAAALASPLPYDRAMDALLARTFAALGSTTSAEARRVLNALDGRWWRSGVTWPSPYIPIAHSFDIGPHVTPMLAPPDVSAPAAPFVLDVPEVDRHGAPLSALYRLAITPDLHAIPHFVEAGAFPVVTGENLPRLVDVVRRAIEVGDETPGAGYVSYGDESASPVAHYLVGLRLFDLKALGGVAAALSGPPKGVFGGSLVAVRGDTRGGDFALLRIDLNHMAERGPIAGVTFFRSDALYFCHDRETGALRAPLLSLLGPCARGEWFGVGGAIGEAFHDGRTGRTALRPLAAYGVLDALGNGQSPSYDGLRLLVRAGGAIEHVWTAQEGAVTIPRASGSAILLARTPGRSVEAYGGVGYRIDPTTPRDAAFESNIRLRWYFLLGGGRAARSPDAVDPWGVASLGLEGGHSYWTRPAHSFADLAAPFVSAERSGTWQVFVTATLGFEGLTF